VYMTAIDHAGQAAVLSKAAMDQLTEGHADEYGVVDAAISFVSTGPCAN